MTADDHLNGHARPTAEQVAWVFQHLNEHYDEGGSFRQLIYKRMGFEETSYTILMGQGLHLSNLLNCARENEQVTKALLECYT